jgi:hypothetical protein
MTTYAVIESNQIVNVIVWDGAATYSPVSNQEVVEISTLPAGAAIGWTRDGGGTWSAPPAPPPPPDE